MFTHKIAFSTQRQALAVQVTKNSELPEAITTLGLATARPVIVLVGGADETALPQAGLMEQLTQLIAQTVEELDATIITGGTASGVMAAMGQARAQGNHQFSLVGVAVEKMVTWPHDLREDTATFGEERTPLEPHHTHFILTPGEEWGDESSWLAVVGTLLARDQPAVTLLINGGEISRRDVNNSLRSGRTVLVLQGTGRLADELAREPARSPTLEVIPAQDKAALQNGLRAYLSALPGPDS